MREPSLSAARCPRIFIAAAPPVRRISISGEAFIKPHDKVRECSAGRMATSSTITTASDASSSNSTPTPTSTCLSTGAICGGASPSTLYCASYFAFSRSTLFRSLPSYFLSLPSYHFSCLTSLSFTLTNCPILPHISQYSPSLRLSSSSASSPAPSSHALSISAAASATSSPLVNGSRRETPPQRIRNLIAT